MLSLFINWDISPEIFNLGGISIRYYGLLFAVAFILGYKVEEKMFMNLFRMTVNFFLFTV